MSSLAIRAVCSPLLAGIVAVTLSACGHQQLGRLPESHSTARIDTHAVHVARRSAGEQAALVAVRQIGVPYVYGGNSIRGFDCSGLVQYAWSKSGTRIPRTTSEQWRWLTPVAKDDLRRGDLLFFRIDGHISHVGLYIGDRRFVHAPSTGRDVTVANLDAEFYRHAFVRAARPD